MHVTFASVISANGRITRGDEPHVHAWSSPEDWKHFARLRDACEVIILDRVSYETIRPQPEPKHLRIVMTHHPELYNEHVVPGQLEFSKEKPHKLLQRLSAAGYKKVLLAGGSTMSHTFLATELVDDIYLTVEPTLFGTGQPVIAEERLEVHLALQEVTQLNERGTLLLHYRTVYGE